MTANYILKSMKHFLPLLVSFLITHSLAAQMPANGLDVQHYRFELQLNDDDNNIKGEANITVQFLKPVEKVSFDLVNKQHTGKGMTVTAVKKMISRYYLHRMHCM